jgi:hypothetical protein
MWHEFGRRGMHRDYWWESQKEREPLGRSRRRWVNNIKMDLGEIEWDGVDWTDLSQDGEQ